MTPFVHQIAMTCGRAAGGRTPFSWRNAEFAPEMIDLPPGEFVMGENADDKFANDTERPAHPVKIPAGVALGRYPVTVGEFRHFRWNHAARDPEQFPVVNVSWHDAVAYCEWLGEKTSRRYRLPTEAEWEFACRAGSQQSFSTGEQISTDDANFLYDENGVKIGIGGRTTVGGYAPNAFGFHDLHGNICEWVADDWHMDYTGAPACGCARVVEKSFRRVIRGGAWDYLPRLLRSSWRDWRAADCRADNIGFRVAAVIEDSRA